MRFYSLLPAIVVAVSAAYPAPASAVFVRGDDLAPAPVLENKHIRVRFDAGDGRLVELVDKAAGHNHIDAQNAAPLWTIELADGRALSSAAANDFTWRFPDGPGGGLELRWRGHGRGDDTAGLQVTVRVSLAADEADCKWRLRVDRLPQTPVAALCFPRTGGLVPLPGERLAVPIWMGQETPHARDRLNSSGGADRWSWEYPGRLSLQCVALYSADGPGLALSTRDAQLHRKHFAIEGDGEGGLFLDVVHRPQPLRTGRDGFELPYPVVTGLFRGGWFTAAERYRSWADHQPWVQNSRVRRGLTPEWVRNTGIWVWNRGRSEGVLQPAQALQEHANLPTSVFWHWWHGCAYDVGFPEYFPPREGEAAFKQAVDEADRHGIHAIVYMNQRLWGMTTESWEREGAERFAVRDATGNVRAEVYNTFTRAPCAAMCMGTPFWRDTYAGLAARAVNGLGVHGIYMDQACLTVDCYDRAHGHPPGGGRWWVDGFEQLAGDIRSRTAERPGTALAGEGCGEAWLPHLDLMLTLQVSMERYAAPGFWSPIPFFHAVYHDSAIFYGNYSSLTRPPYDELWPAEFAPVRQLEPLERKFSAQFRLEQARAFVWGQQPSMANFLPEQLDERAEELAFAVRLAQIRKHARDFLQDGRMLRPLELGLPDREIAMSRLSIYAGQQDAVQEFRMQAPQVLNGVWQAKDGRLALALVNITDRPVAVRAALERRDYPAPERGEWRRIDAQGRTSPGTIDGETLCLDLVLDAFDAVVYELAPAATQQGAG